MPRIAIKPLTVSKAWKGRRFRTDEYNAYEEELSYKLPHIEIPDGPLSIRITFGFSSRGSDWDNPVKPLQDILQNQYGFNDNQIYHAEVTKEIVPKGKEFIDFHIKSLAKRAE